MLKICLARRGKKKYATFRAVVLDKKKTPKADFIESLGFYNPHTKKANFDLKRIKYWVQKGAKKSSRVEGLLKKFDEKKKIVKVSKKRRKVAKQKKEKMKKAKGEDKEKKKGEKDKK